MPVSTFRCALATVRSQYLEVKDGQNQPCRHRLQNLDRRRVAQDQARGTNAGRPQAGRLRNGRRRDPFRAIPQRSAGDLNGSVAVRISLHHGHQWHRMEFAGYLRDVGGKGLQIDLHPGRTTGGSKAHQQMARLLAHQRRAVSRQPGCEPFQPFP